MKHHIRRNQWHCAAYIAVFAILLLASSLPALGQSAGYDLLQTGSGANVDLSSLGLGIVKLQGVPIQACTGNTDTIMYRPQAVPSGGGTIPVNVFALFMESTAPVTYSGKSADVYITINASGGAISTSVVPQPDSLTASGGTITVYTGGTFDSNITVNADVIIVTHGTSPTNSANYLAHQAANAISLSSTGSSWSSTPPAGYPSCSTYPSGGFYPSPGHVNGPHPVSPAGPSPSPSPTPTPSPSPTPTPSGGGGCASNSPSGGNPPAGNGAKKSGDAVICFKDGATL